MEGTVYLAMAETNQSYLNSDVNQRLRLAHVAEVSYTESGAFDTDLTALQNGSDGTMDNVQTLRNTFAADTVSLITETGDACGLGYFMSSVSNGFESFAYSVVKRSCATGYFSFGHELGHNMGADHDAATAPPQVRIPTRLTTRASRPIRGRRSAGATLGQLPVRLCSTSTRARAAGADSAAAATHDRPASGDRSPRRST